MANLTVRIENVKPGDSAAIIAKMKPEYQLEKELSTSPTSALLIFTAAPPVTPAKPE